MGTAPGQQQHPAMPDPAVTVTRSLGLLQRLGFTDYQGLNLIISVAFQVKGRVESDAVEDISWVRRVIEIAGLRLAALTPSPTQRSESADADGRRGRTGRTAQDQQ